MGWYGARYIGRRCVWLLGHGLVHCSKLASQHRRLSDRRCSAAVLARDRAWREMPNEARQRARTEALGPEAAARLAALDDEDDAWATRMRIYRAARAALTARGARETFAADVRALRAELFTAEERVRVEALDRIEVQTPRR